MALTKDHEANVRVSADREAVVDRLLSSLHDGDSGATALMLAGSRVIPAVRAFLFKRDPSGIYQPRRWAIDVLAALHAYDVLADYLSSSRRAADPVERAGDEAVFNAAARALSKVREDWVFDLMTRLAQQRLTAGVVEALGAFDRSAAIPYLIDALAEDDCRLIAEAALRRVRPAALPPLIEAALTPGPSLRGESETSLRQRRSALRLLAEAPLSQAQRLAVRQLVADQDAQIAVLACSLCPLDAPASDRAAAVRRLNELLPEAGWILAMDIKRCLNAYRDEETSNGR